jgi:hypothetical protein
MKMSVRTVSLVLAILLSTVGLQAQDNPIMGTWTLNLSKSKYISEPPPRSRTLKFEPVGSNGLRLINDAVLANGEKTHVEEDFIQDGRPHALHGSANADTHINVQFDERNTQTINYRGGKPVQVLKRIVSPDGRTLTIIVTRTDANGHPVDDVRVFDKQ